MKNEVLSKLMKTSVETLAKDQQKVLVDHAISILQTAVEHLKLGHYEEVQAMMNYSPAGDGMGCDNHYLEFAWETPKPAHDGLDLCELLRLVQSLEEKGKERKWHETRK